MRKQNGITLIALVITIIVILVLAIVGITMIIGNNGIMNKTTTSVERHRNATAEEEIALAWASCETDYDIAKAEKNEITGEVFFTAQNLNKYLVGKGTVSKITYVEKGESTVEYTSSTDKNINKDNFKVNENGKVTYIGKAPRLIDYINLAKRDIENEGKVANTKTIKNYLIENEIYTEDELNVDEKDDFTDIIRVGEENAEVPTNRHNIYFKKPDIFGDGQVFAYIWYADSSNNTVENSSWPGTEINLVENEPNVYKYEVPENENYEWNRIIFNNNNGIQTKDLTIGNNGQILEVPTNIIYAKRIGHFTDPLNIYAWKTVNNETINNGSWPGIEMQYFEDLSGNRVYYYDMNYEEGNTWDNFIINDGNLKTQDIEYNSNKSNKIFCIRDEWVQESNPPKLKETSENAIYGDWINR